MVICTADEITKRRNGFGPIIFTNGCFDLLHEGHVSVIKYCNDISSSLDDPGSIVILGLNDDVSIYQMKGYDRPIRYFDERCEDIEKLGMVDVIVPIYNVSVLDTIKFIWPDHLVKGGSTDIIVGEEFVKSYGGEIHRAPMVDGVSTTNKIKAKAY